MPRNVAYEEDLYEDETYDTYFQEEIDEPDPLQPFLDDGTITDVIGELKSGKEGTVFCCRAHSALGCDLVAAKVFRSRDDRTFRNHSVYREGVVILNKHDARAVKRKSAWGRTFEDASWKYHEYEVLIALSKAGADVPRPIKLSDRVLLMEYIGDEEGAAPKLQESRLQREEAEDLFNRVMRNVELFLSMDLIHGDLSSYNILYWNGSLTIIDFPQAVDARTNRNAVSLLERDIRNVCRYFERYGVHRSAEGLTRSLWRRYMHAEL